MQVQEVGTAGTRKQVLAHSPESEAIEEAIVGDEAKYSKACLS